MVFTNHLISPETVDLQGNCVVETLALGEAQAQVKPGVRLHKGKVSANGSDASSSSVESLVPAEPLFKNTYIVFVPDVSAMLRMPVTRRFFQKRMQPKVNIDFLDLNLYPDLEIPDIHDYLSSENTDSGSKNGSGTQAASGPK
jgi:hypothetical protein